MNQRLFRPYQLGSRTLTNRIVMAPMTRRRAENPGLVPNELMVRYYRQRASAGLIVSEGSQISPEAVGYLCTPGCYTEEQLDGWRKVTRAVHQEGGTIYLQLWHVGPFSHPSLQPGRKAPLSASAVTPEGQVLTPEGRKPRGTSREMSLQDIERTIRDFGQAAQSAVEAGFDGIEVHGAHAYLIDQFIMDGTNKRNDAYGGGIENRSRFLFEVLEEIISHVDSARVGLRLSFQWERSGMRDSDPQITYGYIVRELNRFGLSYLHISENMDPEERLQQPERSVMGYCREAYDGTLISCGGHSPESARGMLNDGFADLIAFGRPYISNPDLVDRLKSGAPLAKAEKDTFYHGGANGYIDYPTRRGGI